jgi:hypothetical protein
LDLNHCLKLGLVAQYFSNTCMSVLIQTIFTAGKVTVFVWISSEEQRLSPYFFFRAGRFLVIQAST